MEILGKGAHGIVYKQGNFALKIGCNILEEYHFTQQINHPNVVKYQLTDDGNLLSPLLKKFQTEISTLEERKKITEQLFQATMAIHQANIAHQDLHESNIMMNDNNNVVIIDFSNVVIATLFDITVDIMMLGEVLRKIWHLDRTSRIRQLILKMERANKSQMTLDKYYRDWLAIKDEIMDNFTTFRVVGRDFLIEIVPKYYKRKESRVLRVIEELQSFHDQSPEHNKPHIRKALDAYLIKQQWATKLTSVKEILINIQSPKNGYR